MIFVMRKRIFSNKIVFYLAIIVTIFLIFFSIMSFLSLFNDFSIITTIITVFSIVVNLFTLVHLIEKYNKAVLFLNLSLGIFMLDSLFYIVLVLKMSLVNLDKVLTSFHFKILLIGTIILIIINKYSLKENKSEIEIESIGKHSE